MARSWAWLHQSIAGYVLCLQGADYTSLGSFGNVEQFGENLVASLDRSFLLRSGFNRPKSVQVGMLG